MFGVNIAPFLLSSSIIGFAVGFGAQSLIKDMLAGVSLLLEPEFRIGSLVEINKEIGEVKKVSLKNTYLLTKKNELVIIPNGLITVIKILK
jgi:small conductance mechanosensitive channel